MPIVTTLTKFFRKVCFNSILILTARVPEFCFTASAMTFLISASSGPTKPQKKIQIMRTFVRMRQLLASQKGLMEKILAIEKKYDKYDEQFQNVFEAIRQLMIEEEKPKKRIGFKTGKDDK